MKHVQRLLLFLTVTLFAVSCTRVVVVERPTSSGNGKYHKGYKQQGNKKGHPHGMPPGQAKKMHRY